MTKKSSTKKASKKAASSGKRTKKPAAAAKSSRGKARAQLTHKQEAFITWYVAAEVNGNGTEAARRAGYKGSDAVLANVAAENLRKPYIREEIDRRMAAIMSGAGITVEKVLRDIEVTRAQALAAGQYSAAIKGAELHGKYLKMFVDRIEHVETIDDVPTEQLVRLLKEISEAGGVDLRAFLAADGPEDGGLSDPAGAAATH